MRVGLIGCGNIALNHHLPGYLARPIASRLVAVADPTPERREMGRSKAGLSEAQAYGDPLALLARDDLDMVDLCTPQHIRRDLAIATVGSGRHLLSEKPIATTPADARADRRRVARGWRALRHRAQLPVLPRGGAHARARRPGRDRRRRGGPAGLARLR